MARLGVEQLAEVDTDGAGAITFGLDADIEIEAPESVNGAAGTCEYSIGIVSNHQIIRIGL